MEISQCHSNVSVGVKCQQWLATNWIFGLQFQLADFKHRFRTIRTMWWAWWRHHIYFSII